MSENHADHAADHVDQPINLHHYKIVNGSLVHVSQGQDFHDTLDEYQYDVFNLVVMGILGSIVNVSGIILTILILFTLSRVHPKSAVVLLLVGIAYTDLVVLFLGQILVFIPRAFGFMTSMVSYVAFVEVDYRYLYPIKDMALIIGTWFLVVLAMERFIVIAYPERRSELLSRKRILAAVIIIVVVAAVFDVPKFFEYHTITHHDVSPHDRQLRIERSKLHHNAAFMWVYMFGADLTVRLFLPFPTLVVFFVLLLSRLKHFKELHANSSMKIKAKAKMTHRVTLMTLALMTSYLLVQLPYLLLAILHASHDDTKPHPHYAKFVNFAIFLQATNAAIKFYIYIFMSSNFRAELKKMFFGGSGGGSGKNDSGGGGGIEDADEAGKKWELTTIHE